MKLDLRKNEKSLLKYIKSRVRDYPLYENSGPGEDDDPIAQITLGFQFDQTGWVALVFDTRPAAALDGVWQNYIEENEHELPNWHAVYLELCENDQAVELIHPDGRRDQPSPEQLLEILGEFLRDLLVACRENGLFDKLPRTLDCRLSVEEHEGQYGWTDAPSGGEEESDDDPFAVSDDLIARTAKLSKNKQITFWVDRLKQIAADTKRDPYDFEYDVDANVNQLAKLGNDAVVPMLKLSIALAGKPQFEGGGSQARELYRSYVLDQLIQKVDDMEHATPEIEKLLRQIVTKAVKTNAGRKLWGTASYFAARALFNLFSGYPCPEIGEDDNALLDPAPFFGPKRK